VGFLEATLWLKAASSVGTISISNETVFRTDHRADWSGFKTLLNSAREKKVKRIELSRFTGTLTAWIEPNPSGWHLIWPCAERWAGFYDTDLVSLPNPLMECGVTSVTLQPY
jgi:hypothetical protein